MRSVCAAIGVDWVVTPSPDPTGPGRIHRKDTMGLGSYLDLKPEQRADLWMMLHKSK